MSLAVLLLVPVGQHSPHTGAVHPPHTGAVIAVQPGRGTLQAAHDAANAEDILELADGDYMGTIDSGNVLRITKSITIRAANRYTRPDGTLSVRLDGDNLRRVILITDIMRGEASGGAGIHTSGHHIYFWGGNIERNNGPPVSPGSGGGVLIMGGSASFESSKIFRNKAPHGGGVRLLTPESVVFRDCEIYENEATDGAGGGVHGGPKSTDVAFYNSVVFDKIWQKRPPTAF